LIRQSSGEVGYDLSFWRDGAPDHQGLAKLDWLMRDVHAGQVNRIDLRVYYLLSMLQTELGGRPIGVTSGYRTKATNERLRQQGLAVVAISCLAAVRRPCAGRVARAVVARRAERPSRSLARRAAPADHGDSATDADLMRRGMGFCRH